MVPRARSCVLALLVLLLPATPAQSGLVTWEFAGELTAIRDTDGSLGDLFTVGTPFSGQYTFDPNTPDASPLNVAFGDYSSAVHAILGQVGDVAFASLVGQKGDIAVFDDFGSDNYSVFGSVEFLLQPAEFSINLADFSQTVFPDDFLPVAPPDLMSFDTVALTVELEPDGDALFGELTSLTPEPGTLSLLALGGALLFRRKR